MNKKNVIIFCIACIILIFLVVVIMICNKKTVIGKFNISEYSEVVIQFSSDKIVGTVQDVETAKEKAESIWIELYGDEVKEKKPYIVSFDELNEVWLVQGSLPENKFGGVPYILIQKSDGKVLAVWHDK